MTSSLSVRDEKFAWENYNRFITVGVNHVKYLRNQENVLSTFCKFGRKKKNFSWNLINEHSLYRNCRAFFAQRGEYAKCFKVFSLV